MDYLDLLKLKQRRQRRYCRRCHRAGCGCFDLGWRAGIIRAQARSLWARGLERINPKTLESKAKRAAGLRS